VRKENREGKKDTKGKKQKTKTVVHFT